MPTLDPFWVTPLIANQLAEVASIYSQATGQKLTISDAAAAVLVASTGSFLEHARNHPPRPEQVLTIPPLEMLEPWRGETATPPAEAEAPNRPTGAILIGITPEQLTATDLRQAAEQLARAGDQLEVYKLMLFRADGMPLAEHAEAVYRVAEKRLGVAWGGEATWADVADLDRGVKMWLSDDLEWERAN